MLRSTSTVIVLCFYFVWARPQQQQPQLQHQQQQGNDQGSTPIPIISQTETSDGNGSFSYSFETGNGIHTSQQGFIKQVAQLQSRGQFSDQDPSAENDGLVQVQSGSYSYTSPDGTVITLNYTADENGFHPQGDHIPTPPPVPEHVAKLLETIAQNPAPVDQGNQQFQNSQQQAQFNAGNSGVPQHFEEVDNEEDSKLFVIQTEDLQQ